MNTKTKSLLIALILGIALLFGIAQSISANASESYKPHPSPTPDVLENGWHRFIDPDAGYTISYPPSSYLDVSDDVALDYNQVTITFPTSSEGNYYSMQIIVYANNEQLSIRQIVDEKVYKGRAPKKGNEIPLTTIKVSDSDAVKMDNMEPFNQAYFISAKNKVYFFSLSSNMLDGTTPPSEAIDLFNQILNTFSIN